MRRLVGFSMLMLALMGARAGASTITFERDSAPTGTVIYSSSRLAIARHSPAYSGSSLPGLTYHS